MALSRRFRRLIVFALAASVLSLVAVFVFSFVTQREVLLEELSGLNPVFFLVAAGLHVLALLFWATRLHWLTEGSGHPVPWVRCVEAVYSSVFAAALTPARFGGEPVRFAVLTSRGMPAREGSLIVLLERGLDLLLFVFIGAWAFAVLVPLLPDTAMLGIVIPVAILVLVGLVFLPIVVVFKPELAIPVMELAERVVGAERLQRAKDWLVLEAARMRRALATVLLNEPTRFVGAIVTTVISWLLEFFVLYYLLVIVFGHPFSFLTVVLGAGLVSLLQTIPLLPGGSGLAEAGVLAVFGPLSAMPVTATVVLVWRASTYFMDALIGGVVAVRFAGAEVLRVLDKDEDAGVIQDAPRGEAPR